MIQTLDYIKFKSLYIYVKLKSGGLPYIVCYIKFLY